MKDWSTACAAHRESVERFVSEAERVAALRWSAEPAPGKWPPAQIAEHLSLTYERLLAELRRRLTVLSPTVMMSRSYTCCVLNTTSRPILAPIMRRYTG